MTSYFLLVNAEWGDYQMYINQGVIAHNFVRHSIVFYTVMTMLLEVVTYLIASFIVSESANHHPMCFRSH
jgi:hypothetical protein